MGLQKPPPNILIGDCSIGSPISERDLQHTVQFYGTKGATEGDMNLDLVDAASGGEVDGAGGAGAIDLRSGETGEKEQIKRAACSVGGLGFRRRPRLRSKAGAAARVRTYVDGQAGGLEAAGRRVGEQRRWDGRLPQAPRRQHRRPHVVAPLFRSEIFFFWICAIPVALRPLPLLSPLPTAARPPEVRAQQLATGGANDAGTGGARVCSVRCRRRDRAAGRQQMGWCGPVR